MLVLARRINEVICIEGGIRIMVVDILAGKCRIGIDAPRHVQIHREEVAADVDRGRATRGEPPLFPRGGAEGGGRP